MNKNYLILALLLFCSLPSARTYAAGGDIPPEVVALTDSLKQNMLPTGVSPSSRQTIRSTASA